MRTLLPVFLLAPVLAQGPGHQRVAEAPTAGDPAKAAAPAAPVMAVPGGIAPAAPSNAHVPLRAGRSLRHQQTEVLFDRPDADGPLWALGSNYKVAVARDRWTYRAATPETAAAVQPIAFRLATVIVGDEQLPLAGAAPVRREGGRLRLDHGSVEERLDLGLAAMEQSFVFHQLPARGEMRIAIAATSDLQVDQEGAGLRFVGDGTDIHYGGAVAIDADGDRTAASTRYVDGRIEIVVPATFVAAANLPLVIDPIVVSRVVSQTNSDHAHPDIAYVPDGTQWHVTYNRIFGPGDWDCFVRRYDSAFNPVGSVVAVDLAAANWIRPRIAHLNPGDVSLVVAEEHGASVRVKVRGRLVGSFGTLPGGPFDIASAAVDSLVPDVGADSNPASGFFTVVWEHAFSGSDHDIYCRQVTNTGVLRGTGPTIVQGNTAYQSNPAISKSCGSTNGNERFVIVYQQQSPALDWDVYGCLLSWSGVISIVGGNNTFPIDTSIASHLRPRVSTPSLPTTSGARRILVAYENAWSLNGDIDVAAIDHAGQVLARANLQVLEGASAVRAGYTQSAPAVDCDGSRFVVTYQEPWQGNQDLECRITEVSYGSNQLFAQNAASFRQSTANEFATDVGSQYAGDGQQHETFGLVNDRDVTGGTYGIDAALYDAAPTGLLAERSTSCGGGLTISRSGALTPGGTVSFALTNTDPIAGFALGGAAALPIGGCASCVLGVANPATLLGTTLAIVVPVDPNLIGASLSVQGWMLGTATATSCLGFLHLSNTHDLTVR